MLLELSIFAIASFLILSVLLIFYYKVAKNNSLETKLERNGFKQKTVIGAGIIFPIAFLVLSLLYDFDNYIFLLGVLILSIIGFLDDIKPIPYTIRLIIQIFICAGILLYSINNELFSVSGLMLFFFILSYINAFNFMDGINGMLGLQSLITLVCLAIINKYLLVFPTELILALCMGTLNFLIGNLRNKPFFISGDVGSISLGLILGYIIINFYLNSGNQMIFLLATICGIETGYTVIVNLFNGASIFKPHRNHLYEQLVFKLSKKDIAVSLAYGAFQFILASLVVYCYCYNIGSWAMLFVIASTVFIIYSIFRWYILKNEVRRKSTN